jgi:Alkylmercury lyase
MTEAAALDRSVRLFVYRRFLADGTPPSCAVAAEELGIEVEEARASFRRLEDAHALVLHPETLDIWMANPLSAIATDFRVETPSGGYFGNCIWDAFGVVAMLGGEGTVATHCPCCNEPLELRVADAKLEPVDGVAHFAVPARRWWDDIGYT